MYQEFAHLWPLVSPPEEYEESARYWRDILRARLGPGRHPVLELGVGGGHHLSHLTADFQATAVDISEAMLAVSRRLNPGVTHVQGDMRSVRLGRTFKAVLIHDAIEYMLTEDDLRATFATARAHLEPGGVFVVAPDWFKETFPGTHVSHFVRTGSEPEFTFIEYVADPDPQDTTVEWVFFYIFRDREGIRVEEDHHLMSLFPRDTWLRLLGEAGFTVELAPYPDYYTGQQVHLLVGVLLQ
ncbi:MAG: class I SAM-dependent methyltransferase [Chloroflexi bacterium]|nr:class I SAM-dependent methyltransferase [Chloroflexota bacterium]